MYVQICSHAVMNAVVKRN